MVNMTEQKVYVLVGVWAGAVDVMKVYADPDPAIKALCDLLDQYDFPDTDDPDIYEQYADIDYYHTPDYEREVLLYRNTPVITAPAPAPAPEDAP